MSIQKNKNDKLVEEVREEMMVSQKVLDALAIGRKKRQDLKEHFPESEILDTVVKPVLKQKKEVEDVKEELIQETKKKYIKRKNLCREFV